MNAMTEIRMSESNAPRVFSWLLAILLPIFAIYPALLNAVEEHAYDAAEFHVFRGVVWSAARADGSFYPRWVQSINGGLGGPLFEFYSPLAYFLMDWYNQFGIPHTIAWRILCALALVAASTGMFRLGLSLFKRADVALLSATLFTYNAYLLRDLFERGSPQGWTVALLPWLLWLLIRSAEKFTAARIALTGLCFAAMILLHNATALLLTPVIAIFLLFRLLHSNLSPVLGLAAGIALAAFYLIPYLFEIRFVQFDNPLSAAYALPASNPLRLQDILSLGHAMDTGLGNNAIGEGGGLLHALVLLLTIPVGIRLYRLRKSPELVFVLLNSSLIVFILWLQTDAASWVWNAMLALNIFQFRWRLLEPFAFVSALVLGYFMIYCAPRAKGAVIAALVSLCILPALPLIYPQLLFRYAQFAPRPTLADVQAFAMSHDAPGLTSFNEYLPRTRQTPILDYATEPIANLPKGAAVSNVSRSNDGLRALIVTPAQFTATLNVLYFPGWAANLDGQAVSIAPSARDGLIELAVPQGTHTVELGYAGTLAQHVGDWVSIAAATAALFLILLNEAKERVLRQRIMRDSSVALLPQDDIEYTAPRWWIPTAILALAALKAGWIDPQTTLFRTASTCSAIQDLPTNIIFDNRIRMCGYVLSRNEYSANDQVRITIYWQVAAPATENDFSFVHLLGDRFNPETGNPLWGQQDKVAPAEHELKAWVPGKLYRDVYEFRIAPNAPGGEYQLEIGWQNKSGARLQPILQENDGRLAVSDLKALTVSGIRIR